MGDVSNHGWSTITRVKTADKRKQKGEASISAGSKVTTGVSSVFSALEESSEARRSRIVAAKQAAADADINFSDEEDEDEFGEEAERKANGAVAEAEEKKEKPKKVKKPKVTVADAAGAMNPSDLSAFLAEISVSPRNHCFLSDSAIHCSPRFTTPQCTQQTGTMEIQYRFFICAGVVCRAS